MRKWVTAGMEGKRRGFIEPGPLPSAGSTKTRELPFWDLHNDVQRSQRSQQEPLGWSAEDWKGPSEVQLFKSKSRQSTSDSPFPQREFCVCQPSMLEQAAGGHSSRLPYVVGSLVWSLSTFSKVTFLEGGDLLSIKNIFFFAASPSPHLHNVSRGPFHKQLGQAEAICSFWHTASGEEQTKTFHLLSRKKFKSQN